MRYVASVVVLGWVVVCGGFGTPVRAGEVNLTTLQAEIRAMRNAYEGRISELEAEVKDLRGGSIQQAKSTLQAIDETLGKKTPADKALQDAPAPVRSSAASGGTPLRSSSRVTLGGYTEFSYTDRGDRIPEFSLDRTVLDIGATISDRIKLYIEFEHETGAVIESGNENGGEWELEQGYLDFSITKSINFRAGMMLVPVGRFNLNHEGFVNNFVSRPLVNRWVIPSTWFEEGVALHGDPVDTKALGISYELGVYNPGVASGANSVEGFREIRNEGASPAFRGKAGALRVVFEPARSAKWFADSFELGVSGYISNYRTPATTNTAGDTFPIAHGALSLAAIDLTYEKKNFGFRAEAATARTSAGANEERKAQSARGIYTEAFYSWKPCFFNEGPIAKSFKDPRLVFATRFDWVELNHGRDDARDLKRVTAGISFRPLSKTVIKLDYQMDFSHSGLTLDTLPDSGRGKRTDAILFGVATGF
ncbi:MAG: hypothetical protein WCT04_06150 [Planctomycetota bacterium]